MTVEQIRELINLAKETGVAVLEVQQGTDRVRIRLAGASADHVVATAPAVAQPKSAHAAIAAAATAEKPASSTVPEPGEPDPSLQYVRSPIVGTFYESPSPGAPPFVRIGERVQPGKVLCIIESMKLMNEIESEVAGLIESKLVQNGQPVEYGEALFAIRPV